VVHSSNQYMVGFVESLGLETISTLDSRLALSKQGQLVFQTSSFAPLTYLKMLWRWGLNILRLDTWVGKFASKFARVYAVQEKRYAFSDPVKLLASLDKGFPSMLQRSLRSQMEAAGFSSNFIDELPLGGIRVNYGQDLRIGSFVGAIGLAGLIGSLWAVKGGNFQVAQGLLDRAKVLNVFRGTSVTRIARNGLDPTSGRPTYTLTAKDEATGVASDRAYDLVFIAAPLDSNAKRPLLSLEGLGDSAPSAADLAIPYHRTVASFFSEAPDPQAFGLEPGTSCPGTVLFLDTADVLNSIGEHGPVNGTEEPTAWKLFSQDVPSREIVDKFFPGQAPTSTCDWHAYPDYMDASQRSRVIPFAVDGDGLFYCNAMESVASCMEVVAVGAKNCVLLAEHYVHGTSELTDASPEAVAQAL